MMTGDVEDKAKALARLIADGKGKAVVLLDVSGISSATDYFVIATTTGAAHCQALRRQAEIYAQQAGLHPACVRRKTPDGSDWNLIDFGSITVHLMSEDARAFYDIETLWHNGRKIDF